jgi:hypothetical protein
MNPKSYDFDVYSNCKVSEKLRYVHRNPVRRGLVSSPELWRWSSYRAFAFGEEGVVKLNWKQERKKRKANLNREGGVPNILAAHYDEFGRQIGRTGYTSAPDATTHPSPDYHTREYGPGYARNG